MSRVLVLGLENISVGEFDAVCTPGWALGGHPSVSGGSSWALAIPDDVAAQPWLQLGRMVVILPEDLPPYVGMIDTPWKATSPVQLTIYDPEYLLNLRAPENIVTYRGSVDAIWRQIINVANSFEDLYVRLGSIGRINRMQREETLDQRPISDQVQALGLRSNTEFVFRPSRGADQRWYVYVDIARELGQDLEYLLSDGDNGNMQVTDANVRGEIFNRLMGINSASTPESRLATEPLQNIESRALYRVRNRVVQYRDVTELSTLTANTQADLDAASYPYLELTVNVTNVDHAFRRLRPGNRLMVHASEIRLPGGKRGWRGKARITNMVQNEAAGAVSMTLIGAL